MINVNTTIQAGGLLEFHDRGDFFRVMDADAPLTVTFYRNGAEVARGVDVGEGYAEKFEGNYFDRITVYSATTQAVQLVARLGNVVNYDKAPTGAVMLVGQQGQFSQELKTVTNATTQLLGANASRRYLLIQNRDAANTLWVVLGTASVTTQNGIAIEPGGSMEMQGYVHSGAIQARSSAVASTANTIVVEG